MSTSNNTTLVKIQQRIDTKENWKVNNPILLLGEVGYEKETRKCKIGDGINHWNELEYAEGGINDNSSNNQIVKLKCFMPISENGDIIILDSVEGLVVGNNLIKAKISNEEFIGWQSREIRSIDTNSNTVILAASFSYHPDYTQAYEPKIKNGVVFAECAINLNTKEPIGTTEVIFEEDDIKYLHVEGFNNVGVHSSTVEGTFNIAASFETHVEGSGNIATGHQAHVEGESCVASGKRSHAGGSGAVASGVITFSHGNSTQAIGPCSHATGDRSVATGNAAHALCYATASRGLGSLSEGFHTQALGDYTHAGGNYSEAIGLGSFAHGDNVKSVGEYSFVIGKYNSATEEDKKYAFILGNGTAESNRKNSATIDRNGSAWFKEGVTVGSDKDSLVTMNQLKYAKIEHYEAQSEDEVKNILLSEIFSLNYYQQKSCQINLKSTDEDAKISNGLWTFEINRETNEAHVVGTSGHLQCSLIYKGGLVQNPSFEAATNPAKGWEIPSHLKDRISVSQENVKEGNGSYSLKIEAVDDGNYYAVTSDPIPVTANNTYGISCDVMTSCEANLAIKYLDANGAKVAIKYLYANKNKWNHLSNISVAPEGAVSCVLILFAATGIAGTIYFDNIDLVENPAPNWTGTEKIIDNLSDWIIVNNEDIATESYVNEKIGDINSKVYHAGTTPPTNTNLLWIDTNSTTGGLKYYNGSSWIVVPVYYN